METTQQQHNAAIVDQFTRQAVPFAEMPNHSDAEAMRLTLETLGVGAGDRVLDVACGPGIVACELARIAHHVTGSDLTPAMLEQARERQRVAGLSNLTWEQGDITGLPYPDEAFDLVVTRYSFHHLLSPGAALAEMKRVCRSGGKVAVIDVLVEPEASAAYDRMERLRDPSHVRALTPADYQQIGEEAGLQPVTSAFYRLGMDLETILRSSFPNPGDADRIRALFEAELAQPVMGVGAEQTGTGIRYYYPITVQVWRKAHAATRDA
jgi:ubiquinone/menaquinone biosynthesis C-methylase UbiE